MDKDVFFRVITVDESVATFDVEPFDGAGDLGGNDLLRLLVRFLAGFVVITAFVARGAHVVLLGLK